MITLSQVKMVASTLVIFLYMLANVLFSQTVQNDLNQKIMMGYQGWFLCGGDKSPVNDWRHWFHNSNDPSYDQVNVDNWPALSEYTERYPTAMHYQDGSTVELYSAYNQSTTMLHFKWMQEYNVYGIYLQRFLGEAVGDSRFFQVRNHVLENVIAAAAQYDRHFALMYDITGVAENGLYEKLVNDWEYLVDTYDLLNQTGYVKQNGKPVIAVWGMGFPHNEVTPETSQKIIDYFHSNAAEKYRAYIVGGVPGYWRTLSNDSKTEPEWANVYRSLDMISPWTVGRYNISSVDSWKAQRIIPDLAECSSHNIDYMPVIFPGGSWFNLSGRIDSTRINDNPRDGGHFYWRQAYNAISAGVQFIYVAMFDEVDEGTAMYKLATNDSDIPAEGTFVPLDADGYDLPSDWYLRLADESQKMLDQTIPLSSNMPIIPTKISVISISVNPTATTMAVGSTQQLVATVLPKNAYDKIVLWSSTAPGVADVNASGKITAYSTGRTTIVATTQDGGLAAECAVTVVEGTAVERVTVSPATATMNVGETLQLVAAIEPADAFNKAVRWTTADASVATVDSTGLVLGVGEGDVSITVKTEDGNKTARSRITVVDPSQKPYTGAPHDIPGTIEAEDYDFGGEGVAYHDADAANNGGQYRPSESVDIETCSAGGYNLGWFNAGEWVEYTINVRTRGQYDITIRVATEQNGGHFHIEFDGRNRTGVLDVPNTGGWQTWQSLIRSNVTLIEGVQVMRIYREVDGADFNIDKLIFTPSTTNVIDESTTPMQNVLYPAFPNPFNSSTMIQFELQKQSHVKVAIFDVLGREIYTLIDEQRPAAVQSVRWDGTNSQYISVPSGVYFIKMETENFIKMNKLLLVK